MQKVRVVTEVHGGAPETPILGHRRRDALQHLVEVGSMHVGTGMQESLELVLLSLDHADALFFVLLLSKQEEGHRGGVSEHVQSVVRKLSLCVWVAQENQTDTTLIAVGQHDGSGSAKRLKDGMAAGRRDDVDGFLAESVSQFLGVDAILTQQSAVARGVTDLPVQRQ